jgi:transcriptional regulator with XRE-family HTH domain
MLSSGQIRGARAILRLAQAELAAAADVSLETVKRIESMEDNLKIRVDTLIKIKTALEKAGIEFIAENGGGAGVRLRNVKR